MLNNDAFIAQFKKKLSESGFELTKKEVKQIVQVNNSLVKELLVSGEGYKLGSLFKAEPVKRKPRTGRNPQTNKEIKIPAKNSVKFKLMENFKKELNGVSDGKEKKADKKDKKSKKK